MGGFPDVFGIGPSYNRADLHGCLFGKSHHVRRVNREARRLDFHSLSKVMEHLNLLVVPAAFTIVNAIFMSAGTTKLFSESKKQTAGELRVVVFVMCTLLAIAFAVPIE